MALSANIPFPAGAKVGVYKRDRFPAHDAPAGEPDHKPLKTATVRKDGTLDFKGLDKGTRYLAAGKVDGEWRYVGFTAK